MGAINVDEILTLDAPPRAGTSNPAARRVARGGVARNVAENLARLGVPTTLIGLVGDDREGHDIVEGTGAAGARLRVDVLPDAETGRYAAIVAPDGSLVLGVASMDIQTRMTPAWLADKAADIDAADWVFADANLPADSLAWLARRAGRLAVDAVSLAKTPRLPASADLLFCNRDEAALLSGGTGDFAMLAEALRARAVKVVVSDGAGGVAWATATASGRLPAPATACVDETGAGDALASGTLYGLTIGDDLARACARGVRAAALTVAVQGPCAPLRADDLREAAA
ncbi:MAG: PfkB family carbohydrate kinase [Alphaproteobacteria bacterium]